MIEGYVPPQLEINPEARKENIKETPRERFDRIYDNPDEVTAPTGEKFMLHDVSPESGTFEAPIFFCPGWLEDPINGKETLERWYEDGRRVLWMDSPHGVDMKNIENYISFDVLTEKGIPEELLTNMPMPEIKKAAAIITSLDAKDLDQVDAVGHSEGGINLAIAALLAPERFRNIVLVDSGGIIGTGSVLSLAIRSLNDTVAMNADAKIKPTENSFKDNAERGKMYFKDTVIDTAEEAYGIPHIDLREILAQLKQKNVTISIVHGEKDLFFPSDRVKETLSDDHHDGIKILEGYRHQGFVLEPTVFAKVINEELKRLETLRKEIE